MIMLANLSFSQQCTKGSSQLPKQQKCIKIKKIQNYHENDIVSS